MNKLRHKPWTNPTNIPLHMFCIPRAMNPLNQLLWRDPVIQLQTAYPVIKVQMIQIVLTSGPTSKDFPMQVNGWQSRRMLFQSGKSVRKSSYKTPAWQFRSHACKYATLIASFQLKSDCESVPCLSDSPISEETNFGQDNGFQSIAWWANGQEVL